KTVENNFQALGRVSEYLLDSLYRGAFAVLIPLGRGTGMSLKTYQAFAYGKAVVSTHVGARGFSVEDGKQLLLVQSPLEIAAGLRRLLAEEPLRKRLGEQAREFALSLDFRKQFAVYGEIINRLLSRVSTETNPRAPALYLVDNHLSDRIGHHYNYTLSIKEACGHAGVVFTSLVNRGAPGDLLTEIAGSGIFAQKLHDANSANPYPVEWLSLRTTYEFLLSNAVFARELEEGLTSRARAEDVIFLPNATPGQLLGVALLLQTKPVMRTLRFVLLVRYALQIVGGPLAQRKSLPDRELMDKYALAFEKLRGVDQVGCVRLATDSAELARDYAVLWKGPVEVLPIPHTLHAGPAPLPAGVPPKDPRKIRVVFMGDAREEKGFELLPALVRGSAVSPEATAIEFVFQAFISSHYHVRMGFVIDEMERLQRPNLHLVKRALPTDEYQGLLQSADLVLIPYDALTYKGRTSGPFMEAICADKPVVVPRSTWMSVMLGDSEAGSQFHSGDAADLVRAVLATITRLAVHREAAKQLGQRFRNEHNPDRFVRKLMGR
ncbi:MAG TPA: glycosyltransferase, partial [Opitutaceae bacterium]|nr:glycosyltransferase [Opitutaceae bacterium]